MHIIALYSCGPGAGCTTVAMALGSAFATLGQHVLLANATLELRRSRGRTTLWRTWHTRMGRRGAGALELVVAPATTAHALVDQLAWLSTQGAELAMMNTDPHLCRTFDLDPVGLGP